ncbi:MAG: SUMF1/EgtB/PvdO family nonheme iron enzyme [Candidatus Omnitrophota bacterium]
MKKLCALLVLLVGALPCLALEEITINLPNLPQGAKPLEMALIPTGTFMMGLPEIEQDRDSNEGPQHHVTITQLFYIGKYEVTQAQWPAVMGSNPAVIYGLSFSG